MRHRVAISYQHVQVDLEVSIRLRRAILVNDVLLVKRIVKANPAFLHNPNFEDKGNTSLHLAAIFGHLDIIKILVSHGHDASAPVDSQSPYSRAPGISLTTDFSTALHLAAANSHPQCVDYLCTAFPRTIDRPDKDGTTPLMLAARNSNPCNLPPSTSLIPPQQQQHQQQQPQRPRSSSNSSEEDTTTLSTLLRHNASVTAVDNAGNTALHSASAWGNLKAFRLLVTAGAPPLARNIAGYMAADYALSAQAAVYFHGLIAEFERLKKGGDQSLQQHQVLHQQQGKLQLNMDTTQGVVTGQNMSPISPTGSRSRPFANDVASVKSPLSRLPGGVRLVMHDDINRQPLPEAPLTARWVGDMPDGIFPPVGTSSASSAGGNAGYNNGGRRFSN
ncbi:hypothetical protein AJ80_05634 [Polytolypa hystricis UAMH7299]|uniref:Uncharacterized protein n=1 Tax=Polytolypa hystricis (strain UAMH7299) TaxID=1447883 RepID=A0A2B7Y2K1_POLH7|nr:hypothetical protein AJ80_05634 [Polytolypa hystricis UAMH7299]